MSISDEQFNTWAKQGAVAGSKATADSIKKVINSYNEFSEGVTFDVYLQGSYKNGTNIYSESDVDVVVKLTSSFRNNLNSTQKKELGLYSAQYGLNDFRKDVLDSLANSYGLENIEPSNKVVKLSPPSVRREADILIGTTYRRYYRVESDTYKEGIYFVTTQTNEHIKAYPKLHSENATEKNKATNGSFKPMVRIFKNIKRTLVGKNELEAKDAPSFFIECFLSNVPAKHYQGSYRDQFIGVYNHLANNSWDDFSRLNQIRSIWGEDKESWTKEKARKYLGKIENLYNQ